MSVTLILPSIIIIDQYVSCPNPPLHYYNRSITVDLTLYHNRREYHTYSREYTQVVPLIMVNLEKQEKEERMIGI